MQHVINVGDKKRENFSDAVVLGFLGVRENLGLSREFSIEDLNDYKMLMLELKSKNLDTNKYIGTYNVTFNNLDIAPHNSENSIRKFGERHSQLLIGGNRRFQFNRLKVNEFYALKKKTYDDLLDGEKEIIDDTNCEYKKLFTLSSTINKKPIRKVY